MTRKRMTELRRRREVEANGLQRYLDYIEYRRGREDGRLGNLKAGLSPAYLLGFQLGRHEGRRPYKPP
ncbi:MAG: hypothetical protein AAFN74_14385 [Myxococcota bacterium]